MVWQGQTLVGRSRTVGGSEPCGMDSLAWIAHETRQIDRGQYIHPDSWGNRKSRGQVRGNLFRQRDPGHFTSCTFADRLAELFVFSGSRLSERVKLLLR